MRFRTLKINKNKTQRLDGGRRGPGPEGGAGRDVRQVRGIENKGPSFVQLGWSRPMAGPLVKATSGREEKSVSRGQTAKHACMCVRARVRALRA